MVAQHREALGGQVVFRDVIDVFVVAPREDDFIQAAAGFVDAVGRLETRDLAVGVGGEKLGENIFVGERASRRKRIAHDRPLRLAPKAENLAEVMDEAGEDHPARLAVAAHRLGGLEEMLELRKIGVGIGIVHELVQVFHGFPDAHGHAVEAEIFAALGDGEIVRLVRVVEPVKLAHRGPRFGFVDAEFFLLLIGRDADCGLAARGGRRGLGVFVF